LSPSELDKLSQKFLEILAQKKPAKYIKAWVVAIARRGNYELLNPKGLKPELISLLNWSRYLPVYDKDDVVKIICSYVNEVTTHAQQHVDKAIVEHKDQYVEFMRLLNETTKDTVDEYLKSVWKKPLSRKAPKKLCDLPNIEIEIEQYYKRQQTRAAVGTASAAVSILTVAAGIGFMLFKAATAGEQSSQPKSASKPSCSL
jgi:hypothetical protein